MSRRTDRIVRVALASLVVAAVGGGSVGPAAAVERAPQRLDALEVAIATPSLVVDPEVPFTLTAGIVDGVPPFLYRWNSPTFGAANTSTWSLVLPSGGSANVTLLALDATGRYGTANATVTVGPPPSVGLVPTVVDAGVGVPFTLGIAVAGGVPPYTLSWSAPAGGTSGTETLDAPATVSEPIVPSAAGPVWIRAAVVDAVTGSASTTTVVATAFPAPAIVALATPPVLEVGAPSVAYAAVTGGTPPVTWHVLAADAQNASSYLAGSVPVDGRVNFTLVAAVEGNLTGRFFVDDGASAEVSVPFVLSVVPAVAASLAIGATEGVPNGTLPVSALLSGGVAPYSYSWSLTDGERSAGTAVAGGAIAWAPVPLVGGYLTVTLTVVDALGAVATESTTVLVASTGAPTTSAPGGVGGLDPVVAGVVGLGLGALAGAVALDRWRRRSPATAAPSAVVVGTPLERILAAGEATDRDTLDFIAREEGLNPDAVDAELDRLERSGRLRIERREDVERLVWLGSGGPSPAAGTAEDP